MAPTRVLAAGFIGLAVLGPSLDVLAFRPGLQMAGMKATTTDTAGKHGDTSGMNTLPVEGSVMLTSPDEALDSSNYHYNSIDSSSGATIDTTLLLLYHYCCYCCCLCNTKTLLCTIILQPKTTHYSWCAY